MAAGRRKNALLSHYRKKHKVKRQNRIVILVIIMFCILALMNTSESDMLQKMRDWAEKFFSETYNLREAAEIVGKAFSDKNDDESAIVVFGKMLLGIEEPEEESTTSKTFNSENSADDAMAGNYSGLAFDIAEVGMPALNQEDLLSMIIEEEIIDTTPNETFEIPSPDIVDNEKYSVPFTFILPLAGYRVTSRFGYRIHPISGNTTFHYGMDLAALAGTKVCSAAEGEIIETGYGSINGNYIKISHKDGFVTHYTHLKTINAAKGQTVAARQMIGTVGSTGYSTGPHLHFEIRKDGKVLDPNDYLAF